MYVVSWHLFTWACQFFITKSTCIINQSIVNVVKLCKTALTGRTSSSWELGQILANLGLFSWHVYLVIENLFVQMNAEAFLDLFFLELFCAGNSEKRFFLEHNSTPICLLISFIGKKIKNNIINFHCGQVIFSGSSSRYKNPWWVGALHWVPGVFAEAHTGQATSIHFA